MTETEGASYGMGMINLKAWDERDKGVEELMQLYKERTSHIKDATYSSSCHLPCPVSVMPVVLSFVCRIRRQAISMILRKWPIHWLRS